MGGIEISVVMITCNRAASAATAVANLLAQQIDAAWPYELIVVDDGSTDDTFARVSQLAAGAAVPFRVLRTAGLGVPAARNFGNAAAAGRWIASFDDDQIATPGWLQALRQVAESSGSRCIGGALALQFPEGMAPVLGPRARAILGEQVFAGRSEPYAPNHLPASNNALIEASLLKDVGGFDESFTTGGSDSDLFARIRAHGEVLWFASDALGYHVIPPQRLQLSYFRWTAHKVGASRARMLLKKPNLWPAAEFVLLRMATTLFRDLPALAFAALRGDSAQVLESRCSLWFTQGLLRCLVACKLPRLAHGETFLKSLDFRRHHGERPD